MILWVELATPSLFNFVFCKDNTLNPSLSKERRKSKPRRNWMPKDVLHQHSPTGSEGPNRPSSHDPRFNPARGRRLPALCTLGTS
ncbi:hypothetical protein QE152_g25218 [Popillia japonica]|uniref:Uncharacterized protein n=1 Tax=Popillia japonica TaxID=7064 RepID=A0AAW1K1Z7_POPJA